MQILYVDNIIEESEFGSMKWPNFQHDIIDNGSLCSVYT